MEFWTGVLEWNGVEWSKILSFCHPSRTGFYCPTYSNVMEWVRFWREAVGKN